MLHHIQKIVEHSTTREHPVMQRAARYCGGLNPQQLPTERTDLYINRVDAGIEQIISMGGLEFIIGVMTLADEAEDWKSMTAQQQKAEQGIAFASCLYFFVVVF